MQESYDSNQVLLHKKDEAVKKSQEEEIEKISQRYEKQVEDLKKQSELDFRLEKEKLLNVSLAYEEINRRNEGLEKEKKNLQVA